MKPFNLTSAINGDTIVNEHGHVMKFIAYVPEASGRGQVVYMDTTNNLLRITSALGVSPYGGNTLYMKSKTIYVNLYDGGCREWYTYDTKEEAQFVAEQRSVGVRVVAVAIPVEV